MGVQLVNNLTKPSNIFQSEFGWAMTLVDGWKRMEGSGRGMVPSHSFPIVFSGPDNAQGTLTWMIVADPIDRLIADRFLTMTLAAGPLDLEVSRTIAEPIFPILGKLIDAQVIKLSDGHMGLELVERIVSADGVTQKCGYQFIVPLYGALNEPITFQRLCYYAPEQAFEQTLPDIKQMARSFHYERPFVLQEQPQVQF
jgi:hypothetical protein